MLDLHIVKRRRDFTVDVRLRLQTGESLALFGPSGSGKSTILSCIADMRKPGTGYLTQDPNLFPHMTVEANVRFARPAPDPNWIARLRDELSLASIWRASAVKISGGQARRVALARMMAMRPSLVLLDEPFAGLDRDLIRDFLCALTNWQRELQFAMIMVGHEPELLQRLCPRVLALEQGKAVQSGTWDEVRRAPATPKLAALLESL